MGKQLKKGQLSLEFVFLVGLAFLVMVVFVASTRSEFDSLNSQEERSLVKDVSIKVQNELVIAANVNNGYTRTFTIPSTLDDINYTIQVINNTLLTQTDDYEYVLSVPSFSGSLQKGDNLINKTDGIIYLN